MHVINASDVIVKKIPLSDTYLTAEILKTEYNDVLRGMMRQKQRMKRVGYTGEVRFQVSFFSISLLNLQ